MNNILFSFSVFPQHGAFTGATSVCALSKSSSITGSSFLTEQSFRAPSAPVVTNIKCALHDEVHDALLSSICSQLREMYFLLRNLEETMQILEYEYDQLKFFDSKYELDVVTKNIMEFEYVKTAKQHIVQQKNNIRDNLVLYNKNQEKMIQEISNLKHQVIDLKHFLHQAHIKVKAYTPEK